MKFFLLLLTTLLIAPSNVAGASFKCSEAKNKIEIIICNDKDISDLDVKLTQAYKATRLNNTKRDSIKVEQKKWLNEIRNKCNDEKCLKNAYEARLKELINPKESGWETFRDENLSISFLHPSNRKVLVGCRNSKNCIALVGKGMQKSDYLLAFEVFEGDLDKVAIENAVFKKQDKNHWIANGRFTEQPVTTLKGLDWQGLKAIVDCGISDSIGFHAGAGECLWAVVSDGKRSVVIDTQGIVGNDEDSLRSIQSIRFVK